MADNGNNLVCVSSEIMVNVPVFVEATQFVSYQHILPYFLSQLVLDNQLHIIRCPVKLDFIPIIVMRWNVICDVVMTLFLQNVTVAMFVYAVDVQKLHWL